MKRDEAERLAIGWDEKGYTFASEADMINVALFGKRAWQWREENPAAVKRGENIRDYASAEELIILINLESLNAVNPNLLKGIADH